MILFYLQPLSPTEAAARAKESAKEIISVKILIDKNSLKKLTGKLFQTIGNLDYAARSKSSPDAGKYYSWIESQKRSQTIYY
ncbi:unnamed protein product [Thlaspi arvense]|uniref:Uncharacterized protein n=1 Tax=Thlaspi arvense TaxID=13288 RepID=A0AAU9SDE0_THLAR|nr:unnamed protein product [Thlaspi arvense]